jgi:hypothetical protein
VTGHVGTQEEQLIPVLHLQTLVQPRADGGYNFLMRSVDWSALTVPNGDTAGQEQRLTDVAEESRGRLLGQTGRRLALEVRHDAEWEGCDQAVVSAMLEGPLCVLDRLGVRREWTVIRRVSHDGGSVAAVDVQCIT